MYKIIGSDQQEYGPVTADQVRQWIREGRLTPQSLLQREGEASWLPLANFQEFAGALPAATPTPMPAGMPGLSLPAHAPKTNKLAITALILGIVSVVFVWCCYGIPFNVVAIILGIIAIIQVKGSQGAQTGKGMAMAGLILGVVSVVLGIALVAYVVSNPEFLETIKRNLQNMKH